MPEGRRALRRPPAAEARRRPLLEPAPELVSVPVSVPEPEPAPASVPGPETLHDLPPEPAGPSRRQGRAVSGSLMLRPLPAVAANRHGIGPAARFGGQRERQAALRPAPRP